MALRYKDTPLVIDGKKVRQVTILQAERTYYEGKMVWLHPCNMIVNNVWQRPMPLCKKDVENNAFKHKSDFMGEVNEFKYYNCDNYRGRYPIFFVEI